MTVNFRFLLLACVLYVQHPFVHAQGVKDCDGALVLATYSSSQSRFWDWRLAERVSQAQYNDVKKNAGASGAIYGVPIGADYAEFRSNFNSFNRQKNESITEEVFRNIAWTGLDANSVRAYEECLRHASNKNLILIPRTATATDLTFDLLYHVIGKARNPLPVRWTGSVPKGSKLPRKVEGGSNPVLVLRPKTTSTLTVSGDGLSDSVVITPLPPELKEQYRFAYKCEIEKTPQPLPELTKGKSTVWSCPRLQAGTYQVRINVRPTVKSFRTNQVRVHYALGLDINGAGTPSRKHVLTKDSIMDIGFSEGLPNTFSSSDQNVTVGSGDLVQVRLTINGVADRCCWHTTQYDDGTVYIPAGVSIRLTKL